MSTPEMDLLDSELSSRWKERGFGKERYLSVFDGFAELSIQQGNRPADKTAYWEGGRIWLYLEDLKLPSTFRYKYPPKKIAPFDFKINFEVADVASAQEHVASRFKQLIPALDLASVRATDTLAFGMDTLQRCQFLDGEMHRCSVLTIGNRCSCD